MIKGNTGVKFDLKPCHSQFPVQQWGKAGSSRINEKKTNKKKNNKLSSWQPKSASFLFVDHLRGMLHVISSTTMSTTKQRIKPPSWTLVCLKQSKMN